MGIEGHQKGQLRGDASVIKKESTHESRTQFSDDSVFEEKSPGNISVNLKDNQESLDGTKGCYIPPHLRKADAQTGSTGGKYIPPHLRHR